MYQKPYACFGYVVLANYYAKGEAFEVKTSSSSNTVLYVVKGHVIARNKETGDIAAQYFPGSLMKEHADMTYEMTAMEDTICFCYDPITNKGHLPDIDKFEVSKGQSASLANNAKLFLCEGNLSIDVATFTGPYQIRVSTGDKTVKANEDSYGLLIK